MRAYARILNCEEGSDTIICVASGMRRPQRYRATQAGERGREGRPATEEAEADESCRRIPVPEPRKIKNTTIVVFFIAWHRDEQSEFCGAHNGDSN
jgi:hypothetical protein